MVDEKELKIIEEISKEKNLTQRELSRRTRLSLGAVNVILKRLVKRGLLKTINLTAKKVEYIITPKGFAEKAKKSYHYILKTINLVRVVRDEIAKIVLEEYNRGQKKFVILGNDDLADLIELALKGFDYQRTIDLKRVKNKDALVLISKSGVKANGFRAINLAERLAEIYWGVDLKPHEIRQKQG